MNNKTIRNQTIALAGIAQAVYLVQQIAKQGSADQIPLENSIGSVLKIDAVDVDAIYGGLSGLSCGLKQLQNQLTGSSSLDPEQARYAATLLFLERKLSANPAMIQTIRIGVSRAAAQADHYSPLHENVFASLADLYQETVSTINPKIIIKGDPTYLTDNRYADKIRALLLAGIRSAVLWRQCGGTRWKFFFFRSKMLAECGQLLNRL